MFQQTPLTTYAFLIVITYLGNIISFFVTCNAKEELSMIRTYVKTAQLVTILVLGAAMIFFSKFNILSLLMAATLGVCFLLNKEEHKEGYKEKQERMIFPVLAIMLFAAIQEKERLMIINVSAFILLYTLLSTTLMLDRKFQEKTKASPLHLKNPIKETLLYNSSYLFTGLFLILLNSLW